METTIYVAKCGSEESNINIHEFNCPKVQTFLTLVSNDLRVNARIIQDRIFSTHDRITIQGKANNPSESKDKIQERWWSSLRKPAHHPKMSSFGTNIVTFRMDERARKKKVGHEIVVGSRYLLSVFLKCSRSRRFLPQIRDLSFMQRLNSPLRGSACDWERKVASLATLRSSTPLRFRGSLPFS